MKKFLLSLATLTVCASSSYAATYIEPNLEGKILVKIDQIQIDSNTMRWMANYLAELAEQQAGSNDPKKLQASAKLIALAEQLDKSLPQISAANLKLKQGTQSKENEKRAEHKRKRLFGILEYLATDESNSEGKLLVQLTKDALAAIVPEKSPLAQYSAPNQLWQNSIAKYDNFKRTNDPKIVSNDQIKYSKVKSIVKPKIDLPAAKPKAPEQITNAQWRLREFTVVAPLTTYKIVGEYNNSVYSTGLKKMAVKITPLSANDDLKFIFHSKPNHERDHLAYLTHRVSRPLQSQWKNIPSAKFTFQLSDAYSYRSDRDLTSSALTVAFDAALLGTSVKGNLLVIASIDHNAEFKRSQRFWQTLALLTEEVRDSRILVGQGSEEYLLQILALGHPEFFIQNEVIEVKNLTQARKLTSKEDHADYSEATALFTEVKSSIERKSLRSMTKNKYVREKLERVLEIMPGHLSAKILLEYGSRKNPSLLESKYFAISMKYLLDPINQKLTRGDDDSFSDRYAMEQRDQISKGLKTVKDIISTEDQIVYDKVDEICEVLRRFSRVKKNSTDENRTSTTYYSKASIKILRELKSLNNEIQVDLARLSGIPRKEE